VDQREGCASTGQNKDVHLAWNAPADCARERSVATKAVRWRDSARAIPARDLPVVELHAVELVEVLPPNYCLLGFGYFLQS